MLVRHGDTSAHNTGQYGNTTMAVVAVVTVDLKACSEDRGLLLTTCTCFATCYYRLLPLHFAAGPRLGLSTWVFFFKVACKPRQE